MTIPYPFNFFGRASSNKATLPNGCFLQKSESNAGGHGNFPQCIIGLRNFYPHGWLPKSDIFWVPAVVNSSICTLLQGNLRSCKNSWIYIRCNSGYIGLWGWEYWYIFSCDGTYLTNVSAKVEFLDKKNLHKYHHSIALHLLLVKIKVFH